MSVSEGPSPRSPANFCAQAADLVRVRSLSCTRNGRSRHFRQKNTYVLAQFPSDPLPGLLWPRCLPDASQMSPRCLPDASQMPLRCLSDASQMPLRCLQMLPRCLQMLPQKNCLGSRAGVIFRHLFEFSPGGRTNTGRQRGHAERKLQTRSFRDCSTFSGSPSL